MKKRLITFSADKTFNSSIEYDEKSQRWRAEKNFTETDYFLTEDQAQDWISQKSGVPKTDEVSVSQPGPMAQKPQAKPAGNVLPPPPKPMPKTSTIDLPVGHDNPKVSLPIASSKGRLVKTDRFPNPNDKSFTTKGTCKDCGKANVALLSEKKPICDNCADERQARRP